MERRRSLICTMLASIFFCFPLQAVQVWDGVVSSVTDDNIQITNDSVIGSHIDVKAETTNIFVSLAQDSTLFGSGELHLFAAVNRKIQFDLSHSLKFTGSTSDLLVTVNGGGTVEFVLYDDMKVTFTATDEGGGAKFYVIMDVSDQPTVKFIRNSQASDSNVEIVVAEKSIISYLAKTGCLKVLTRLEQLNLFLKILLQIQDE